MMDSVSGSPPRRRGKEVADEGIGGIIRITPAWAGKSQGHRADRGAEQDHPRMGGEKPNSRRMSSCRVGSPPRGRGKVDGPPAQVGRGRITPAQAGKSPGSASGWPRRRDHPRVGGEKRHSMAMSRRVMGSPPHGRGKVRLAPLIQLLVGITPAWAGKSMTAPGRSSRTGDHPRVGGEKYIIWSRSCIR